jgi:putative membrane protein insertion efficiency factor
MLKPLLLALLRAYQWIFRPLLGNRCRFYPSCSDYAAEAIERHGAVAGTFLAACRVCRCHPFHPGGYDPVPEAIGPLDPPRPTPIDPRSHVR